MSNPLHSPVRSVLRPAVLPMGHAALLQGVGVPAGPYISAPTSVTVVEPVTNPPTFVMNIVYLGDGSVEAGDIPQIQFDAAGTIYDGAAIVDPETDEPDFSGAGLPTLSIGSHTARIRFVRDEGGPGEIIGAWGTSNSFEIVGNRWALEDDSGTWQLEDGSGAWQLEAA